MSEALPPPEHIEPAPHPGSEGPATNTAAHKRIRFAVWAVALVLFAGFLSLLRVHTYLGVESEVWDKHGRDYIWSVWWRARHDMIGSAPSGLFVVMYIGLIIAFLGLSILALWLALVPDESPARRDSDLSEATAQ